MTCTTQKKPKKSPSDTRPSRPRAKCPYCWKAIGTNKDGLYNDHKQPKNMGGNWCHGSHVTAN